MKLDHLKRREFITLVGGAAAAWPLGARTQQAERLPTIGVLASGTQASHGYWFAALAQRLRELGWIEGRTIAVEYRWAEGRPERFTEIATEFVTLKVDVIVTAATAPVLAVKQATSAIPIVFAMAGDPIGTGIVASLARPGGNITGLSNQSPDLAGKRLELLREVLPGLRRLAFLGRISNPIGVVEMGEVEAARPGARPRSRHTRASASGGYRARPPGAQGPRGCNLCLSRAARVQQPDSNQHLGTRRATADDARLS
jgi:ABC-type uncharacterized transport system substrate-binding protein